MLVAWGVLINYEYGIQHAIKLSALNIAEQDEILYMPYGGEPQTPVLVI